MHFTLRSLGTVTLQPLISSLLLVEHHISGYVCKAVVLENLQLTLNDLNILKISTASELFCSKIASPKVKFDWTPSSIFLGVFISFASSCTDVRETVTGSEQSGFN